MTKINLNWSFKLGSAIAATPGSRFPWSSGLRGIRRLWLGSPTLAEVFFTKLTHSISGWTLCHSDFMLWQMLWWCKAGQHKHISKEESSLNKTCLCLHTYIHGKSGAHGSPYFKAVPSVYFTLIPLSLTANMNEENDSGTEDATLTSTHPPFLFLSLNSTWNIILKTFEFNPKLALSISYCWFMITIQTQPLIPQVGPVQYKILFAHISLQGRVRLKVPSSSLSRNFPAPLLIFFTCVYPHSANVCGDPFNTGMNYACTELLLLVECPISVFPGRRKEAPLGKNCRLCCAWNMSCLTNFPCLMSTNRTLLVPHLFSTSMLQHRHYCAANSTCWDSKWSGGRQEAWGDILHGRALPAHPCPLTNWLGFASLLNRLGLSWSMKTQHSLSLQNKALVLAAWRMRLAPHEWVEQRHSCEAMHAVIRLGLSRGKMH